MPTPLVVAAALVVVAAGATAHGAAMDLKQAAAQAKADLAAKHGAGERARIDRGVDQIASLWRASDGDLAAFAREHFLPRGDKLDATFERFEKMLEQIDGHELEIGRALKTPTELDVGPLLAVDPLFAGVDLSAHVSDDLFDSKLAFVALLNFPLTTLKERLAEGKRYTRRQWAEARLTARFARRVPAEVQKEIARAGAAADLYIAEYNVWMHHLVGDKGERLFPKGLRLISHWNLRDELKADYADPKGRDKQRTIVKVMERIVTQTIPAAVIDNPRVDWNPFTNAVTAAPPEEIEDDAPAGTAALAPSGEREPDVRYRRLYDQFRSARLADPYSPSVPTAIARSFELGRELPEERVVALLEEILTSPLVARVAKRIEARLGRPLEPQDLWYNGFQPRSGLAEAELDALVRKRYPTAQAFAADIPRILGDLGFPAERARHVASHIVVEPARGAGHAMQSMRRGDDPHLRTRVEKDGMNYKGYNIAVHELGHNVEQVFSLYDVDHTLLAGVPNAAFTEALAFLFQARDLDLLGVRRPADAEAERARVLNDFWQAWEIAGVGLVDIRAWHWMYDHPDAPPAELRAAVERIARDVWNRHYAPVLHSKDTPLLAIYSHIVAYPLYVCDYPLGHLIAFQVEEHLRKKGGPIGPEFERMARFGSVAPDVWMENATGAPVGAGPLLRATAAAVEAR
ncbi:MAG TPA: hypothetical protein VKE22_22465 [Haliangiales bacterium]|nr:hypothetical protein [Haliangiales bacterium]